jgi:CheY-like chemotaxis protein
MTVEQPAITPSVLVVDDEREMRVLAKYMLRKGGFEVVDEAVNGLEALERFVALDPPPIPTVVLLDNLMPGLSGLDAAAQMLARHPQQVIVLFSAALTAQIREQARAVGIAACVSKMQTPKLPQILRDLLQQA